MYDVARQKYTLEASNKSSSKLDYFSKVVDSLIPLRMKKLLKIILVNKSLINTFEKIFSKNEMIMNFLLK